MLAYAVWMKLFLCLFSTSAWIKVEQLKPYHAHKEEMIKINKGKRFQQAVDAVEEFLRRAKGKDQVRETAVLPSNVRPVVLHGYQQMICVRHTSFLCDASKRTTVSRTMPVASFSEAHFF